MAIRDYYVVLGVPRSETREGIRAAFRDLAKRYHPDRSGQGSEMRFREIREAYEVLSDPERRRAYNHSLTPEPTSGSGLSGPAAEPLRPEAESIFARPESVRPSYAEVRDRWARNFTGLGVPKAERPRALDLDLFLSPEEARFGCTVPIGVPLFRRCVECGGSGGAWPFPCPACGATGWIEDLETIEVGIPGGIGPGMILEAPLETRGVTNLVLRLRPRIGKEFSVA